MFNVNFENSSVEFAGRNIGNTSVLPGGIALGIPDGTTNLGSTTYFGTETTLEGSSVGDGPGSEYNQ